MIFLRSIFFLFLLMCYFFSCPGLSLSQTKYEFVNQWGSSGSGNGQFNGPVGITIDPYWNVYVADTLKNRIQKFAPVSPLMYGNFGTGVGIWEWNGTTWSQITPNAPTAMVVSGLLLYGNFGTGAGIWMWDGTSWTQITPNNPTSMVVP